MNNLIHIHFYFNNKVYCRKFVLGDYPVTKRSLGILNSLNNSDHPVIQKIYTFLHGIWRLKKGKDPCLAYKGEKNPKLAFTNVCTEIARREIMIHVHELMYITTSIKDILENVHDNLAEIFGLMLIDQHFDSAKKVCHLEVSYEDFGFKEKDLRAKIALAAIQKLKDTGFDFYLDIARDELQKCSLSFSDIGIDERQILVEAAKIRAKTEIQNYLSRYKAEIPWSMQYYSFFLIAAIQILEPFGLSLQAIMSKKKAEYLEALAEQYEKEKQHKNLAAA